MLELFRFFRVGIVNVVGVTVPGVLFLLFAGVGFVLPLTLFVLYFNQLLTNVPHHEGWLLAGTTYRENKATLTVLFFVIAYVIGYIIRLSSPDELDRKSAKKSMRLVARDNPRLATRQARRMAKKDCALAGKAAEEKGLKLSRKRERARKLLRKVKRALKLLRKMKRVVVPGGKVRGALEFGKYSRDVATFDIGASDAKRFPYRGERVDKFPYKHFRDYLADRGFEEYAKCVPLYVETPSAETLRPPPEDASAAPPKGRWTKTAVNMMKLEVQLLSPVLASIIESNEAHIRLLSGTWQAINACRRIVAVGVGLALLGSAANVLDKTQQLPAAFAGPLPPFLPCLLAGLVLYMGMRWARRRIETMFHHQRVRELAHIVGCFYFACEKYAGDVAAGGRGAGHEG